MKISAFSSCVLASTYATLAHSMIFLDDLPTTISVGETHEVTWFTDHAYELELHLVRQGTGNVAWTDEGTLFDALSLEPGEGSYSWTVPSVRYPAANWSLWLSGDNIPPDNRGYANLTSWFQIEGAGRDTNSGSDGITRGPSARQMADMAIGAMAMLSLAVLVAFVAYRARRSRKPAWMGSACEECHRRGSYDTIAEQKARSFAAMKEVEA